MNDILVEKTEEFWVYLHSFLPTVHLEPNVTRIYIFDDDRKFIKMTNVEFLYFLTPKYMYTIIISSKRHRGYYLFQRYRNAASIRTCHLLVGSN